MATKSSYAEKQKGTRTPGPAGDQRPLLSGMRLAALQCTCGFRGGRFDPLFVCVPCLDIAAHLSKKRPNAANAPGVTQ